MEGCSGTSTGSWALGVVGFKFWNGRYALVDDDLRRFTPSATGEVTNDYV